MRKRLLLNCGLLLGAAAAMSLASGLAIAQPDPGAPPENHYRVYELSDPAPPSVTGPIVLRDQFSTITLSTIVMKKLGVPTEKYLTDASGNPTGDVFGIIDPLRHYTWWRFDHPELVRRVDALDQFGGYSWRLRDSKFLLTPTAKSETAQPPTAVPPGNHYKCYETDDAPFINVTVGLKDQVDSVGVVVLQGVYFCNPVEKTFEGVTHEMADSLVHLTCYQVLDSTTYENAYLTLDQFGSWSVTLNYSSLLCLPAEKGVVVRTEPASWGRIKALYN